MEMIEHDHVSEYQEFARDPCLIECIADQPGELGRAEDRQSILGDRS